MLLTDLQIQKKNPNRVSLFLDKKYFCSLNLDQILEYKLKKGQEIDQALSEVLKKVSGEGIIYLKALSWATYKPRSEKQLNDYFRRKKIEPDLATTIANKLISKKIIDNSSFAKLKVQSLTRKLKSKRQMQMELAKTGIKSDNNLDEVNELENLKLLIAKKQKRYPDQKKFMAYLYAQGYAFSDIKKLLQGQDFDF